MDTTKHGPKCYPKHCIFTYHQPLPSLIHSHGYGQLSHNVVGVASYIGSYGTCLTTLSLCKSILAFFYLKWYQTNVSVFILCHLDPVQLSLVVNIPPVDKHYLKQRIRPVQKIARSKKMVYLSNVYFMKNTFPSVYRNRWISFSSIEISRIF